MRVVFFGTPALAVPTLDALCEHDDLRPVLVVSQPSRPAGRGRQVKEPPVIQAADRHRLDHEQPKSVKTKKFLDRIRKLEPDVAVVVAFGQIFPADLLEIPEHGCINVHASLLPKYRGASPIQAAIAAGERVTGVCTMRMDEGLDTGPILRKKATPLGPEETAPELGERLARLGAELLVDTLRDLEQGSIDEEKQDDDAATWAPRIDKSYGRIDWSRRAFDLYDHWRAVQPWPGLHSVLEGEPVRIIACRYRPGGSDPEAAEKTPGAVLGVEDGALEIACGDGTILAVDRLQRPGKNVLSAPDFVNGERLEPGTRFGDDT